jgi:hypothetical protein
MKVKVVLIAGASLAAYLACVWIYHFAVGVSL